jgi:hypothetical protein
MPRFAFAFEKLTLDDVLRPADRGVIGIPCFL